MVARVVQRADVADAAHECVCAPLPRGDVARVRAAARRATALGVELRQTAFTLLSVSGTSVWSGVAFSSFSSSMRANAPRLSATADRYDQYANALSRYADSLDVAASELPWLSREISWRRDELSSLRSGVAAGAVTGSASAEVRRQALAEDELRSWVRRFLDLHGQWVDAVDQATRALLAANAHDPTRDLHGWKAFTHDVSKVAHAASLKNLSSLCDELATGLTAIGVGLMFVFPPAGIACLTAATVVSAVKFGTDVARSVEGQHLGFGALAMSAMAAIPVAGKGIKLGEEVIEIGSKLEQPLTRLVPGGGLARHEGVDGGHVLGAHVRPRSYPRSRLQDRPDLDASSVFLDRRVAETAIGSAIEGHEASIGRWLHSSKSGMTIEARFDVQVGWVLERDATAEIAATGVRLILRRSEALEIGYRVHTAMVFT